MKQRIGLFGGTFDPVHNAHLALARAALDALQLQQLRWIPTGQPWYRAQPGTAPEHRAAMVDLAIAGAAGDPRFVLDPIELQRPGPGYTLDTVRTLAASQPQAAWFLIIGQDQYARFHTWHGWRELLGLVTLAVANRPGPAPAPDPAVQAVGHAVIPLPLIDISASELRARAATGGDISQLVPPEVARYIERHGLYRAALRN